MGTITINGKRFDGNTVTIRDRKVVIDGKPQDGELHGDVALQVVDGAPGSAECIASVTCSEAQGDVAAGAAATAGPRAGGAIRAVAFASAGNGLRKKKQR